jgi:hypothetical protein
MSNKSSHQLHELIHAMSRAEKRYFKLFSERHHTKEKKGYLQLFDEIGKQLNYDEEELLASFEGQAIVQHFSLAKNRLYHLVLKALSAFHLQHSVNAELGQLLHYAEILYQKALYSQCEKVLQSAQKIAVRHENHGALLQIINRQKRLAERDHYESSKGSTIENIHQREQKALKKASLESELWLSKSNIFFSLFNKGQVRDRKIAEQLFPEVENLALMVKVGPASFEAKYLAGHTRSAYFFALGDYPNTHAQLVANLALLDDNFEKVKQEPEVLVGVLANLAYVSAKLNYFDQVDKYLQRSRALPSLLKERLTDHLEQTIFAHGHSRELAICNLNGDVQRGMKVVNHLEKALPKRDEQLSAVRKAGFYHGISTMYYLNGDTKSALRWNNLLLNEISVDRTEDQYCFALIFHLLLHYELNNASVMPSALRSLERYLDTRERKFKFEKTFVTFVKNSLNAIPSTKEQAPALASFSKAIANIQDDPYEKTALEYFDFQSWAEAKLSNRPVTDVLKEKAPSRDLL